MVLLLIFFSGYLISTADGRAIPVFEVFHVPALTYAIDNQEDIAGDIHQYLVYLLIAMVSLHALAAIKHQFINKDGTLMRMIKPSLTHGHEHKVPDNREG